MQYLHHGYAASLGKIIKLSGPRSVFLQIQLPYQRLDQRFATPDVTIRTTHEQLGITGELLFHPKALKGKMSTGPLGTRLFYSIGAGYAFARSGTWKNGDGVYLSSPKGSTLFTVGMGQRRAMIRSRIVVSPFIKIYASPWREIGDYQKAILGTALNAPSGGHIVWQANAGIEFTWLKKEKTKKAFGDNYSTKELNPLRKFNMPITLSELNRSIQSVIEGTFSNKTFDLIAEIGQVNIKKESKVAYLDLVEKGTKSGEFIARSAAQIWGKEFETIQEFERVTGFPFKVESRSS